MLGPVRDLRGDATLGKFRVVLPLGQGGTADVYLAVADGPGGFQKLVVLKVLKPGLASDPEFRAMFSSEARLAARLQHPNVVQTNEVLDIDGMPAMVMEYLDGQPLSQVIVRGQQDRERGGFALAMQVRVLIDALAGLHAAHELGDVDGTPLRVVHRDVSPHNLFVTIEGQAKVLDFGIAKLSRSLVETEAGTIKGKLRYMAPEQIAGAALDRRADIYATGVILWEALAGDRMWKGCSEQEIRSRVRAGDLPAPHAAPAGAPAALAHICRRALALSPGDRQATAIELADELEAVLPALGPPVSRREIGATVARLFADVRAATRAAIAAKLGPLAAGTSSAVPSKQPGTHESAPHPSSREDDLAGRGHGRGRPRSWWVLATAALIVAGALAAGAFAAGRWMLGRPGADAPTARAAGNPAMAAPPWSGSPEPEPGAISARAARGASEPASRDALPDRKDERGGRAGRLTTPRPSQKRAAPEPAAPEAPAPPASGAPATTAPIDCTHPFFVDGDGIKKVRTECR